MITFLLATILYFQPVADHSIEQPEIAYRHRGKQNKKRRRGGQGLR